MQGKLALYPTVTSSEFTLTFNNKSTTDQPAMIRVVNASGTTMQNSKLVLKPGMNNIPMSLMKQASGTYYVKSDAHCFQCCTNSNSDQTVIKTFSLLERSSTGHKTSVSCVPVL